MKNVLVIFVLLVFALGNSLTSAASKKEAISDIDKIEKETQACLDAGINMTNCNYVAIDRYEIEIAKTMKKFKKLLSKSQYDGLLSSQKKWEEFYKQNNAFVKETIENNVGTIFLTMGSTYRVNPVKIRAKELEDLYGLYKYLKEDEKETMKFLRKYKD